MFDLNKNWITIECPNCSYQDEIQLIDVKTKKTVFCHNCKIKINLLDGDASVHTGVNNINEAFDKINKLFKNFGK